MPALTVYCVQPYSRKVAFAAPGRLRQFESELEAMRAAERLALHSAEVEVFSVSGDPTLEEWEPPVLLAYFEEGVLREGMAAAA